MNVPPCSHIGDIQNRFCWKKYSYDPSSSLSEKLNWHMEHQQIIDFFFFFFGGGQVNYCLMNLSIRFFPNWASTYTLTPYYASLSVSVLFSGIRIAKFFKVKNMVDILDSRMQKAMWRILCRDLQNHFIHVTFKTIKTVLSWMWLMREFAEPCSAGQICTVGSPMSKAAVTCH